MEFNKDVAHWNSVKSSVNKGRDETSVEETKCFESNDQTSLKSSGEEMASWGQRWKWQQA
eukprot:3267933-Ditylum_brightwellii.AAC.1